MDEADRFAKRVKAPKARAFYTEAASRWPRVSIEGERFAEFVLARLKAGALEALRGEELYLACGCAAKDPAALRAFERDYMPSVRAALDGDLAAHCDEVEQRLRQKFFVGDGARVPKIDSYLGTGSLKGWVRACAVREALNLKRSERKNVELDEARLEVAMEPAQSVETAQLKAGYQREFKAAFEHALSELSARDRVVLRYHFVDGATIDDLGRIYSVHRTTAARWLRDIRAQLFRMTKAHLVGALELNDSDFESIVNLVRSQLDASISRVLAE